MSFTCSVDNRCNSLCTSHYNRIFKFTVSWQGIANIEILHLKTDDLSKLLLGDFLNLKMILKIQPRILLALSAAAGQSANLIWWHLLSPHLQQFSIQDLGNLFSSFQKHQTMNADISYIKLNFLCSSVVFFPMTKKAPKYTTEYALCTMYYSNKLAITKI